MMAPDLIFRAVLAGLAGAAMPPLPAGRGLVHLTARAKGKPLARLWAEAGDLATALAQGLAQVPAGLEMPAARSSPLRPPISGRRMPLPPGSIWRG